MPKLSIVVPIFNEAQNLPLLYQRLSHTMQDLEADWEWIAVDDHSADESFAVLSEIAGRDPRIRVIRLARNCGSHTAITCGLQHASGDCAVVLAADLQDPPEMIQQLLSEWRLGKQVVWAVREQREGETLITRGLARAFYFIMRHIVGLREMPATGADYLLIDRRVIDGFRQFGECNVSVMALIGWMGFHQTTIPYTKQARASGRSGWTLEKKLKLAVDSITSFTYLPIRLMSYVGATVALLGFMYAGVAISLALRGHSMQGWASLMVIVLVLGGIQMLMMGVLGEYLWRALDESRRRPRYLIEAEAGEGKAVSKSSPVGLLGRTGTPEAREDVFEHRS